MRIVVRTIKFKETNYYPHVVHRSCYSLATCSVVLFHHVFACPMALWFLVGVSCIRLSSVGANHIFKYDLGWQSRQTRSVAIDTNIEIYIYIYILSGNTSSIWSNQLNDAFLVKQLNKRPQNRFTRNPETVPLAVYGPISRLLSEPTSGVTPECSSVTYKAAPARFLLTDCY